MLNSMKVKMNKFRLFLLLILSSIFITTFIYITHDDGIYYVYKDNLYPFKTYPESNPKKTEDDLNIYTKMVYPETEVDTEYEMVDESYIDGSELDRAEESLFFEYNENIIEYDEENKFIMEALELLDPSTPSVQTYGIYEKQPILVKAIYLDNDYSIIDEDISKNFYFEQASVDLITEVNNFYVAELDDPLIVTDDVSLIPNESIDLEQLLRNSEIFNYNEPNEDIVLAMAPVESENNEAEISEVDTVSVLEEDFIYPISKPTKLIEPITKSDIIDEFVTATATDIVEFKKVYYGVQVSSVETRLEATNIYETLLTQYSSVLNRSNQSHKNLIKQDDLGSMGIWYKLRIGPFDDRSTAKKLCSSLRDEGLPGCIVVELE
ncbi:MAG: SPOR domain-containing protein [Alphaproteobacteria bacterium]|nr:SPOR domain-containing protein [Alphaproteobacteria bacterium]